MNGITNNPVEVWPINPVSNAIINKYRPTKNIYTPSTGFVYVVRDNTIITVIRHDPEQWKKTNGIEVVGGIFAPVEHHQEIRDFVTNLNK